MNSRQLEDRLGAYFQHGRAVLLPDELVARVLDIPAAHPQASAPTSRLLPRSHPHGRRLMVLLAAALLTAAAVASAIAIGQSWPITVEVLPPPDPRGEFQPVGMLPQDVTPQALVAQPDGTALLIGDRDIFRFDPGSGRFALAGRLQIPRTLPATVVLDDGRVLIVGGGHDVMSPPPSDAYHAEIYDPTAGTTRLTAPTIHPRAWGSATLLEDGRVLVTGGEAQGFAVATAEIFDPSTETFLETGAMSRPRSYHAAVRLHDGRVLLVGGAGSDAPPDAELFDPVTGQFSAARPMPLPPGGQFGGGQNAVLLPDGRVLILEAVGDGAELTTTVQFYDPGSDEFTLGPSVPSPRQAHRIALLDDGRVLILGGWGRDAVADGDDAFMYDPAAETIVAIDPLNDPRLAPFIATLSDGRVLVVGSQCWNQGCYGLDAIPDAADRAISAEIFD
jgi:hypothetical protein